MSSVGLLLQTLHLYRDVHVETMIHYVCFKSMQVQSINLPLSSTNSAFMSQGTNTGYAVGVVVIMLAPAQVIQVRFLVQLQIRMRKCNMPRMVVPSLIERGDS